MTKQLLNSQGIFSRIESSW